MITLPSVRFFLGDELFKIFHSPANHEGDTPITKTFVDVCVAGIESSWTNRGHNLEHSRVSVRDPIS